jgi:hypothetical protein
MTEKLSKFRDVCPRQLLNTPCDACPLALDRINAIKAENTAERKRNDMVEPNVGCPWFIASADHNYCFWAYDESLYNDPATDREICDLLLVNKSTVDREFKSGIAKLEAIKDSKEIQDFRDSVLDAAESAEVDLTAYMPDEFRAVIAQPQSTDEPRPDKPLKPKVKLRRHPTGLPLHRDGRKVDLWGISGKQARERISAEKAEKKNANKKDKK